jgi:uncharacterized protein YjbI with pentapeptide repeats
MEKMSFTQVLSDYRNGRINFSNISMQNADMSNVSLPGIIFTGSDLSATNFSNSDLTGAIFADCNLSRCLFDKAVLKNSNFECANLTRASIRGVVIDKTIFRKANFMWAHLCGNDLVRADLTDAVLDWSCLIGTNISDEQAAAIPEQALLTRSSQHSEKDYASLQAKTGYGEINQGSQNYSSPQGPAEGNYVIGAASEYQSEVKKEIGPPGLQKKKEDHKEY